MAPNGLSWKKKKKKKRSRGTLHYFIISPPRPTLIYMHTRGRVIFIPASWQWLCTDPLQNGKTRKTSQRFHSVHPNPREADVISCYPCFPQSKKACMHHVSETWKLGKSALSLLNNISGSWMCLIWVGSRIQGCIIFSDALSVIHSALYFPYMLCILEYLDAFAYPQRNYE